MAEVFCVDGWHVLSVALGRRRAGAARRVFRGTDLTDPVSREKWRCADCKHVAAIAEFLIESVSR